VSDLGIASFADLQAEASITQSSGDTTISFGLGQNVTLTGVTINELSDSDFIFA
jgi:hypothetical protein